MPCYSPLKAIVNGYHLKTGKQKLKILKKPYDLNVHFDYTLPCQKCIGCRLEYSRQWATRCALEIKEHPYNYFVTLTYNDENLTYKTTTNHSTGEVSKKPSLDPNHLKKFLKDLRRYYKYHYNHDNIRFFACGEYGELKQRPHFHLIIFNLPIVDLKYFFRNKLDQIFYTSKIIQKIWNKGFISIGEATWDSSAYTARYIMKKQKGNGWRTHYTELGIEPEFTRMSTAPGIGRLYYEKNKNYIYKYDQINIKNMKGVFSVKPPRYYDRRYEIDNPLHLEQIKEKRVQFMNDRDKQILSQTNLSAGEYLKNQYYIKLQQSRNLKRSLK